MVVALYFAPVRCVQDFDVMRINLKVVFSFIFANSSRFSGFKLQMKNKFVFFRLLLFSFSKRLTAKLTNTTYKVEY